MLPGGLCRKYLLKDGGRLHRQHFLSPIREINTFEKSIPGRPGTIHPVSLSRVWRERGRQPRTTAVGGESGDRGQMVSFSKLIGAATAPRETQVPPRPAPHPRTRGRPRATALTSSTASQLGPEACVESSADLPSGPQRRPPCGDQPGGAEGSRSGWRAGPRSHPGHHPLGSPF